MGESGGISDELRQALFTRIGVTAVKLQGLGHDRPGHLCGWSLAVTAFPIGHGFSSIMIFLIGFLPTLFAVWTTGSLKN